MSLEKWIQRQQEILNMAKGEQRDLTDGEKREFDELQGKIDTYRAQQQEGGTADNSGEALQRAIAEERQRVAEIDTICREFGIETNEFIRNGNSIADVRAYVLEGLKKSGQPISIKTAHDEGDKFREAAVDSILMRSDMQPEEAVEGARELMGMSLRDLAIECLQRDGSESGVNRRSNDELFSMLQRQFMNPTAAFPSILDSAINKAYVEGHRKVAVTFDRWTSKGALKDFKTTTDHNYLAGPAGEFLEIAEGGELRHDTPKDMLLPNRKLRTYGRQFTMSRQAFINDDIGFLTTIPARYAASARKTINKQVYQILTKNPAIYDGVPLFHTAHKNLIVTGTEITIESLQKIIMAMQKQTDPFGEAILITPFCLLVPVGYGFILKTILTSQTVNTTGNTQAANPLYNYPIEVVEDPTLNALMDDGEPMPWFLVGSPNDAKSIQVDYLNGQEIPTIRRMEAAGQLGFVWDIYLDWGVSVMDFRGIAKNPGIKLID